MSDAPRYPDTDGKSLDNQVRELKDYIINLHRYIRYALNNISARNMTSNTASAVRKVDKLSGETQELSSTVKQTAESVSSTVQRVTKVEKDLENIETLSVVDTTVKYAVSDSTERPISWVDDMPTAPAGQYLWTMTTVTYSDGKTSTTYSYALQGEKGDKGDQGDTGLQGIQGPKGDTGDTGPQGPQGIQGEAGEQGPQGIQGEKGDTGAQGPQGIQGEPGADGVDIEATTRYYMLSTSFPAKPSINPPPSTWGSTEPSYTAGSEENLYFTDCTEFSDGTFSYSDVSLSSSYAAAKAAYYEAKSAKSEINQLADKISLSVKTENGIASIVIGTDGTGKAGEIDLTGMVTFGDLENSGKTIINADNIKTGKISAVGIEFEGYWSDNYYRKVVIDNDDFSFYGGNSSDSLELRSRTLDTGSEFYSLYHTPDETLVHGSNIGYVGLIHTRAAEGDDYNDKLFIGGGLPGMAEVPLDLQITSTGTLGMYSNGELSITGSPITLNGAEPFTKNDKIPVANGGTGRSTLTSGYFLRGNGTSAVTMSSAASARSAMGLGNSTGALGIAYGGTGATTANDAANNLCEVGTWTPTLTNASGAWPAYTYAWNYGYYVKIGRLVWVSCDIAPGISSKGGNYAQISGLPYASDGYYGLVMALCYQVCSSVSESISPVACTDGTNVRIYTPNGVSSYNWMVNTSVGTNAGRLRFSGVYRTS